MLQYGQQQGRKEGDLQEIHDVEQDPNYQVDERREIMSCWNW